MASVGTVSVRLEAKSGAFDTAMGKAARTLGKLSEQLTKTKIVTRKADGTFEKASLTLRGKVVEALNRVKGGSKEASKEVKGLSSSLGAAAGAAAAFASVTAGFNLARDATNAGQASEIFAGLGGDIDKARAAVGGMVDDASLIKKANLAETMGINADAFERLAKISTAAAAKTGQSVDFMFDSIITGTARQSRMILDNLGILVSVESANKKYAKSNNLVATSLTDVQKRAAFQAEVFAQGDRMTRQLAEAGVSLINPFDKAAASILNIADDVGALLAPAFIELLPLLDRATEFIDDMRNNFARLEPGAKAVVTQISAFGLAAVTIVGGLGALTAAIGVLGGAFAAAALAALPLLLVMLKVVLIVGGLMALAGALRAAWEENIGGIREKWWGLVDTVQNVGKLIAGIALDLFTFLEDGFDAVFRFVAVAMTILPRVWIRAVTSILEGFEKLLAAGKAAAQALGLDSVAATIGKAQGALAGVRATVQGLEGDLDGAIDTAAEFLNPLKVLKTGATGTFKFLFGDGGKDFAKSAGSFLSETGSLIGRGWKLLLKDAGVDLDNLILPKTKVKTIGKDIGDKAGAEITKAMSKARDQFAELLGKFRSREAASSSPFTAITAELLKGAKEQSDAMKLAAKAGRDVGEAMELSRKNTARAVAAQVNGYTSLDEFSAAAEFARARMAAVGVSAEMLDENLRFEPGDFSDVLSKRVGEALDAGLSAGGIELQGADRKKIVDNFSDALAAGMTGQTVDLEGIFEALGTLIGGADLGGLGSAAGELFGVLEEAADPAVAANLELAASASAAAAALDQIAAGGGEGSGDLEDGLNSLLAPLGDVADGAGDASAGLGDAASSAGSAVQGMEALGGLAGGGASAGGATAAAGASTAAAGGATAAATGAVSGAAGAGAGAAGAGAGGALGSLGGPVGIAAGLAIGAVVAKVLPMVISAFQQVASMIVSAAGAIPKAFDAVVKKLASFTGDSRLSESLAAMNIPLLGTAAILAAIAGVLSVVFLPVLLLVAGQLLVAGVALGAIAVAALILAPVLIALAIIVLGVLSVLAVVVVGIYLVSVAIFALIVVVAALALAAILLANGLGLFLVVVALVIAVAFLPLIAVVVALVAVFALAMASIAAAAGLFSLAMKTDSFDRFQKAFAGSMDRIVAALEPFFANLMWMAGLFDALLSVVIPLADAFANNAQAGRILFDVFKFLAIIVGHVVLAVGLFVSAVLAGVFALGHALGGFADFMANLPDLIGNLFRSGLAVVFDGLASVLENIPGFGDMAEALEDQADDLRDANVAVGASAVGDDLRAIGDAALALSPDMDAMGQALEDLTDLTFDEAMARGEILAKEKEASEALTNVPAGFKVAAARFRAIVAEDLSSGVVGGDGAATSSPGSNFFVESVTVAAENVGDLVDQIIEAQRTGGLQFAGRDAAFNDGQNNGSSS